MDWYQAGLVGFPFGWWIHLGASKASEAEWLLRVQGREFCRRRKRPHNARLVGLWGHRGGTDME